MSNPLIEMDMVDCIRSWQVGVRKRKNLQREKEKREEKRKSLRGRHHYFGRLASSVLNIGGSKQLSLSAECLQCDQKIPSLCKKRKKNLVKLCQLVMVLIQIKAVIQLQLDNMWNTTTKNKMKTFTSTGLIFQL